MRISREAFQLSVSVCTHAYFISRLKRNLERRCFDIGTKEQLINEDIREKEVRVIDADGSQLGIMSTSAALQLAAEKKLDLVNVAPSAKPPVCKILDYGKFRYEQQKKEKEAKKRKLAIENGYDMEKSFASKSVWARIAVIAAGPVFNFLLAFVCAVVIVGSLGYDPCDIDVIKDNSPATEAGLQEGDVITKVNGHKVTFYRDFYFYRAYNADKTLNITFTRDGEKMTTTVTPQHIKQQKYQVGIMMNENCLISSVTKDSPAEKAGLKANDVIKAVDGTAMENSSSVTEAITSSGGSSVTFTVARDGKNVDVTVEPKMVEVESYDTGFVVYGDRVKTSPIGTLKYSVEEVGYSVKTVIQSLGMLFTGKIGFDSLLGPVGTVSTMSEIVEESKADGAFYVFLNLMNLAALISANLGVMNLLPIPALDGGRLVFLIIEALRGKPVKREHEGIVNFIGMILLVILMVVVLFKDIMALF